MEHTISKVIGSSNNVIKSSKTNIMIFPSIFRKREPLSPNELYSSLADFPEEDENAEVFPLSAFGYKRSVNTSNHSETKSLNIDPVVVKKIQSKVPAVIKHPKVKTNSVAKINEKKSSDITTNNKNHSPKLSIKKDV